MALNRTKAKGRRSGGRFAGIPHSVMDHPDYIALSANAIRLLLEMARQYNGHNNGDLSAAFSVLRNRGFRSKTTLAKALRELEERRLLLCTRPWRFLNPGSQCALYGLTWLAIDECGRKGLEVKPTQKPVRSFSAEIIKMPGPESVTSGTSFCDQRPQKQG
jgi:hypothetical protein